MKKAMFLVVVSLMSVITIALAQPVKAQPVPTLIYMNPTVLDLTSVDPGAIFRMDAVVDIGSNQMFVWTLSLTWDPAVIDLNINPIEGPFMSSQVGQTLFQWKEVNHAAGFVEELFCGSMTLLPATGTGVIATFEFRAVNPGFTIVDLKGPATAVDPTRPLWLDLAGNEYPFDTVTDGQVTVVSEFPMLLVAPIFIVITLTTVFVTKRTWARRRWTPVNAP